MRRLLLCSVWVLAFFASHPGSATASAASTSTTSVTTGSPQPTSLPKDVVDVPETVVDLTSGKQKRHVPDYDGRPEPAVEAKDIALAVPRMILYPAYLVSEYIIRRPLGWLTTTAEKNDWPGLLMDFFTFGDDRTAGVLPIAYVDVGFRPTAGFYLFWNDVAVDNHDLRFQLTTGGARAFAGRIAERFTFEDDSKIELYFGAKRKPDNLFDGIGRTSDDDFRAWFANDLLEATLTYYMPLLDSGHVEIFTGLRYHNMLGDSYLDEEDRSIASRVRDGAYLTPPGFASDYGVYRYGISLGWDTRREHPAPGSGMRLEAFAEQAFDFSTDLDTGWLKYGGSAGGFLDLSQENRNVGLSVDALFVDPLGRGGADVPFTELVGLGGIGEMRGFRPGSIIGRSAIAATLEYRYPVWVFFDGSAHFSVGNAFGPHLDGFDWEDLRMSFGMGIRSLSRRDTSFNVLVALGTDTFRNGASIDSFRLVLGTSRGF